MGLPIAAVPPMVQPTSKPKRSRLLFWIIGGAAALFLIVCGVVGVAAVKIVQAFREQASAQSTPTEPAAVDVASKEVSAGTNSQTEASVRKRNREFRVRQYLEGYMKNGRRDEPCDAGKPFNFSTTGLPPILGMLRIPTCLRLNCKRTNWWPNRVATTRWCLRLLPPPATK